MLVHFGLASYFVMRTLSWKPHMAVEWCAMHKSKTFPRAVCNRLGYPPFVWVRVSRNICLVVGFFTHAIFATLANASSGKAWLPTLKYETLSILQCPCSQHSLVCACSFRKIQCADLWIEDRREWHSQHVRHHVLQQNAWGVLWVLARNSKKLWLIFILDSDIYIGSCGWYLYWKGAGVDVLSFGHDALIEEQGKTLLRCLHQKVYMLQVTKNCRPHIHPDR